MKMRISVLLSLLLVIIAWPCGQGLFAQHLSGNGDGYTSSAYTRSGAVINPSTPHSSGSGDGYTSSAYTRSGAVINPSTPHTSGSGDGYAMGSFTGLVGTASPSPSPSPTPVAIPTPSPTPTVSDTTPPGGSVSINSGASSTNSATVTLSLSATDDVGVTAYYLSTSSSTPGASASGWNPVTSAASYSGSVSYTLEGGDGNKTVYVWYKDFTGNVSGASNASITLDATAPTITITSPTPDATYTTTNSTVSLGGSASDATSGVKNVTWSNNKGGSGTASGTTSWTISGISLSTGDNAITVTATDNAGNATTDVLTVKYTVPTPTPSPALAVTPSPTPQPLPSPSPTATATTTPTPKPSPSATAIPAPTPSPTPVTIPTPQASPSPVLQPSPSPTATAIPSPQPSPSPTTVVIPSPTPVITSTPQVVPSPTPVVSPTLQPVPSPTPQAQPPTAVTGSATNVAATSATLTGTVNANGLSTTAWFEYGTVKGNYGNKTTSQTVTGSSDTTVNITITGLTAGTTYYYRIVAQNNAGTMYGGEMPFQYAPPGSAPTVETESATNVTTTSATLNGKVNPNGLSTTAWFEYGTVSGVYPYQTDTQGLSGSTYTSVSATITGLTAGTRYYYRIVAQNTTGTTKGGEMSFYKALEPTVTPTPAVTFIPTPKVSPTPKPSPQPTVSPVLTPKPKPTPSPGKGYVFGTVSDEEGNHLSGVTVTLVGANGSSPTQNSVERRYLFALQVGANTSSPSQDSTTTDADGYYEFGDLDAGDYTLAFRKVGYVTQTQAITLQTGQILDMGETVLEVITYGKIYGTVVDIKGKPVESVGLKLKGLRTKATKTEASDADGFFEFEDLRADTYVITAKKKRYKTVKKSVKIEDGESKETEIEMRKTTKRVKADE